MIKNTDNNMQSSKRGRTAADEWQRRARFLLRHIDDPLALEMSPVCRISELVRFAKERYPRSIVARGHALHDLIIECLEEIENELNGHDSVSKLKEFVRMTRQGKGVSEAARTLKVTPEYASRGFKRILVSFLADKLQMKLHTPES